MAEPDWRRLLSFAHELGDLARSIAQRWYRSSLVQLKPDRTPVTEADLAIEQALRGRIRSAFPHHGIRGEEQGHERPDAELCWVLDPIDGTKSFAVGSPMFGCLIGLAWHGRPVLGVMDAPALHERWTAAPGIPAEHNGQRIAVRQPRLLADAVLATTTADRVGARGFAALREQVAFTVHGGDCIAYGLLAMGGIDVLVDRGLEPHDFCALVPIVEGAGGAMIDWQGRTLDLDSDGAVVAASHKALAMRALEVVATA
jgi:inositol-phosphate phosphatase/L-galactose 1-phosphate phosphatase/histidinol-phosphatase